MERSDWDSWDSAWRFSLLASCCVNGIAEMNFLISGVGGD